MTINQKKYLKKNITIEQAIQGGTFTLVLSDRTSIEVEISPGTRNGAFLWLSERGNRVFSEEDGHLRIQFIILEHPVFKIEEDQIFTRVSVSPIEAELGCKKEIPYPTDEKIIAKILPKTKHGDIFVIKGQGLANSNGKGDLIVSVEIDDHDYFEDYHPDENIGGHLLN